MPRHIYNGLWRLLIEIGGVLIKSRKRAFIVAAALILSLVLNGYFISTLKKNNQESIDTDFIAAIGRISGTIDSVTNSNYEGYIFAIEHASKAYALSKYTSYHNNSIIPGVTAEFIHLFRNLYANKKPLISKEEIREVFTSISANPDNIALYDQAMELLNQSLGSSFK